MKKLILLFIFFVIIIKSHAQEIAANSSVGGLFETVFDQYGNTYNLSELKIGAPTKSKLNSTMLSSTLLCTTGIFELYFEAGCGMDIVSDITQNNLNSARRAVACQVFTDLSNFINTPLKNLGNTTKIKIWVRGISQVGAPQNALGMATSVTCKPIATPSGIGGIADNEIWKTIISGTDSFTNVVNPPITGGQSSQVSGLYYHGIMAFNFTNFTNWNTNLAINAPLGQLDLYTIMLHEVIHSLGFASLIRGDGTSFGGNYYIRYDRFLKNSDSSKFLITNNNSCDMYNYSFNPLLLSAILQPSLPCLTQQTTCGTAIKFVGTSTVPVYTPNCFEPGSSLSHFEDQCIGSPNGNNSNSYFVMTDANGAGVTKRFLKPEEKNALGDIGYSLNGTYGNNANVFNSFINYGLVTNGVNVAGINDGLNPDGTFKYFDIQNSQITINSSTNSLIRILSNDPNATNFECLQDLYDTTATFNGLQTLSGSNTTNVVFSSSIKGLHLLRYIPVNSINGQKGNITYIYVYVDTATNCAISTNSSDLVLNGGFEQVSSVPDSMTQIEKACGWFNSGSASTDLLSSLSNDLRIKIPCSRSYGFQDCNNNTGSNYIGMANVKNYYAQEMNAESVKTKLKNALLPNANYQLSFDVSQSENGSSSAMKFQAYFGMNGNPISGSGNIPIANSNMLFTNPTFSSNTDGWDKVVMNVNSINGGEQYLYIGALSDNVQFQLKTAAPLGVGGCNYNNNYNLSPWITKFTAFYFVDNISLIPLNSGSINLPGSICNGQNLNSLGNYLNNIATTGVFSGLGITLLNGIYSFNSTIAGLGTKLISYSYTNISGNQVTIYHNIVVSDCSSISCPGSLIFNNPQTVTGVTYQASNSIITDTNYLVNAGSIKTLKAGNSVTLSPNSEVKANSTSNFTAQIANCTQTSARIAGNNIIEDLPIEKGNVEIVIYPNPFEKMFNIQVVGDELSKIKVATLDGKIIYDIQNLEKETYIFQSEILPNGIYLVNIETKNGTMFNKKIIKN
ncbi:MAG: T9SS type A sorting domain-containing protein [Flavobacterium sp.]|nr:T9SS type A sorting domain-containing protein [Flavobacterium sp.]